MNENQLRTRLRSLYTIAMVNVGIWTIGMIALIILLQKGGNLKGMYVILVTGIGISIQITTSISKLRKQ